MDSRVSRRETAARATILTYHRLSAKPFEAAVPVADAHFHGAEILAGRQVRIHLAELELEDHGCLPRHVDEALANVADVDLDE